MSTDAQPLPTSPPAPPHDHHELGGALAGAIRVVFSFTLLSRLAGLAREVLNARVLGDTLVGSAFASAFIVPNLFRRLFGEGALTAAFLPEYTRLSKDNPDIARRLASIVIAALTLLTGAITLAIEGILFLSLSMGWTGSDSILSVKLTMLMLPMMPMVCVTAILGGMLQAHGRFGPPAAAPIILNVFMIAGGATHFFLPDQTKEGTAYWIGFAAVAASIAQIAWSLGALRGIVSWTRVWHGVGPAAFTVLRRFGPVVIGLGALQLSTMVDQLIAMWPVWIEPSITRAIFGTESFPLDEASNAILSTTTRLYQFPLGVFGLAVATAVFPLLSRTAKDPAAFAHMLRRGLRISLLIGLPASAGLLLASNDLVSVMLAGGNESYSADGIARSAAVLVGFAPAVWVYSLNNVLTRAFYSQDDTRTPMTISLISVGLNLVFNLVLIWPLREAGLAWATAASASVQFAMLLYLCRSRLGIFAIDRETVGAAARILLCTLVMSAAVWATGHFLPQTDTWATHAYRLAAIVVVGMGSFALVAFALRLPELRWVTQRGPAGGAGAYLTE